MKWLTLTGSLLPTADHLIYGIGSLYVIFLVGGGMSQANWSSNSSFPAPLFFIGLDEMPMESPTSPPKINQIHMSPTHQISPASPYNAPLCSHDMFFVPHDLLPIPVDLFHVEDARIYNTTSLQLHTADC